MTVLQLIEIFDNSQHIEKRNEERTEKMEGNKCISNDLETTKMKKWEQVGKDKGRWIPNKTWLGSNVCSTSDPTTSSLKPLN